jgi:beta-lactamase class D
MTGTIKDGKMEKVQKNSTSEIHTVNFQTKPFGTNTGGVYWSYFKIRILDEDWSPGANRKVLENIAGQIAKGFDLPLEIRKKANEDPYRLVLLLDGEPVMTLNLKPLLRTNEYEFITSFIVPPNAAKSSGQPGMAGPIPEPVGLTPILVTSTSSASAGPISIPESVIESAFAGQKGTFVELDCASNAILTFHPDAASEKLPPCSTFKIWNTLIGVEEGVLSSPEESFYHWDGETRFLPDWNQDLTLKEAFQVSCVPAFQNLARKIGPQRMQFWIDRMGYGDRDLSAGIDVFWLPAPGRKTLLISPEEQAKLICRLISGKLPFSGKSQSVLKKLMTLQKTERGILYGKTGSGTQIAGKFDLGWFVGYVESHGKTYAFACAIQGDGMTGKKARALVETILTKQGLL